MNPPTLLIGVSPHRMRELSSSTSIPHFRNDYPLVSFGKFSPFIGEIGQIRVWSNSFDEIIQDWGGALRIANACYAPCVSDANKRFSKGLRAGATESGKGGSAAN
jgi:hypothetical protein